MNYLSEVNGPSIFIPIDEVGTFGFGVKEVSGFSVNGVNGEMGGILRYGLPEINKLAGKTINQNEFSINTEKSHATFYPFSSEKHLLENDFTNNELYKSLNGQWDFKLYRNIDSVPSNFFLKKRKH